MVVYEHDGTVKLLECPMKHQLPEIMRIFHDVSGHDGINTTYITISSKYFWKGISQDVKNYVSYS